MVGQFWPRYNFRLFYIPSFTEVYFVIETTSFIVLARIVELQNREKALRELGALFLQIYGKRV